MKQSVAPQRWMNDALMRQSRPLETLKGSDKKVSLHNNLIRDIPENNLLRRNTSQEEGHKLFKTLSNALWYLDGRSKPSKMHPRKGRMLRLSRKGKVIYFSLSIINTRHSVKVVTVTFCILQIYFHHF